MDELGRKTKPILKPLRLPHLLNQVTWALHLGTIGSWTPAALQLPGAVFLGLPWGPGVGSSTVRTHCMICRWTHHATLTWDPGWESYIKIIPGTVLLLEDIFSPVTLRIKQATICSSLCVVRKLRTKIWNFLWFSSLQKLLFTFNHFLPSPNIVGTAGYFNAYFHSSIEVRIMCYL